MGDYERVKEAADLKAYAEANLEKSKGGAYCCPACGSGTHRGHNSTGALTIKPDGTYWKCHSCGVSGDIYDLVGIVNKTDDSHEQLVIAADFAGVALEREATDEPRGFQAKWSADKGPETAGETGKEKKSTDTPKPDYTAGREHHRRYIAECAKRLEEQPADDVLSYLSERGLSHDEAVMLGIGYDPEPAHGWQDEAEEWHRSPRIVLPWLGCDYYHIDRAIDARAVNLKYDKPATAPTDKTPIDECVGEQPLYNPDAFGQSYVVVVEGVLDAMAIQLCGYSAIALGGTGVNNFATEAAARNYHGVVIDMLDADGDENTKGRGAGAKLADLMAEAGITYLPRAEYGIGEADTYGGYKDAGEYFANNRDGLAQMLEYMRACAIEKAQSAKEAEYREAMRSFNVKDPATIADDILCLRGVYEPVSTGIAALDEALNGGVSLGETTFFGAVSSYGKTTLAVQIADHMASAGRSVLFVTIEQSAKEIISKSLSRLVYTENETGWNVATPQEITSLRTRNGWGEGQNATLSKAVDDYRRMIAPNMRILEGSRQQTVADIRAIAYKMAEHDGQAPMVFIDYLQLLAPLSERYDTDKRNADVNVSELRKMARDLNTHVWCISSLNRSSYSGVISLDSFKESGGIEYGADNLLGLQPRNMAEQLDGVPESKMKREADKIVKTSKRKLERDCELVVLKQRNGALPDEPLPLTFKPMCAYFIEPGSAAQKAQARPKKTII